MYCAQHMAKLSTFELKLEHIRRLALGTIGLGPKYHLGFVRPNGRQMQEVAQLLAEGKLKAVIDKTFRLEDAA